MLFELDLQTRCVCPMTLQRSAKRAAQSTLAAIPKTILKTYLKNRPSPYQIGLAIVSAQAIHKLNKKYRHKNRPTDVLSFSDLEVAGVPNGPFIGEVLVCLAVAKRQAKASKISLKLEFQELVVHGVLHLFGYDHEVSANEAKRMFRLQAKIMGTLE